jgi:hypothetical protein
MKKAAIMFGKRHYLIAALVIAFIVLIGALALLLPPWLSRHTAPVAAPAPEAYDVQAAIKAAEAITPEMIGYRETAGFTVPFRESRAIAVDREERIYVAGDRGIAIFSPDGQKLSDIALKGEPRCLAVGGPEHGAPGNLYVGMEDHIEVFDPKGERVAIWPSQGEKPYFTSIALSDYEIWVADAVNRVVWCYDLHGKPLSPLGKSGSAGGAEFIVANHYFDLAAGRDDLLYVVNSGLLRVEAFTRNGDREAVWGKGSPAVADFFGRANPAHLALLPDGNFVTAEQGIPRVKIYSRRGEFQTVVACPLQLTDTPAGVAGDRHGRVLVLDANTAKVRVFEKKK